MAQAKVLLGRDTACAATFKKHLKTTLFMEAYH